jgi:hypothetical protein
MIGVSAKYEWTLGSLFRTVSSFDSFPDANDLLNEIIPRLYQVTSPPRFLKVLITSKDQLPDEADIKQAKKAIRMIHNSIKTNSSV